MRTPSFPAIAAALFTAGAKAATNNTWQEDALFEVTYLYRQKQVYLADRLKKLFIPVKILHLNSIKHRVMTLKIFS